jgi:hypothetical protein
LRSIPFMPFVGFLRACDGMKPEGRAEASKMVYAWRRLDIEHIWETHVAGKAMSEFMQAASASHPQSVNSKGVEK